MKLRTGKNILFLTMWFTGLIFILLAPQSVLTSSSVRILVELLATVIPSFQKIAQISLIPEIAQAYFAFMWLLALIWLPFYFVLENEQIRPYAILSKHRIAFFFLAPTAIAIYFWVVWVFPFSGNGIQIRTMLNTRFGLGLFGGLLMCGVPLFIRIVRMWIQYVPRIINDIRLNTSREKE